MELSHKDLHTIALTLRMYLAMVDDDQEASELLHRVELEARK